MDEFEAQDAMHVDYRYEMGRGEGTLTVGSGEQFPAVVHAHSWSVKLTDTPRVLVPSSRLQSQFQRWGFSIPWRLQWACSTLIHFCGGME
jgi:hypothetical protein